MRFCAMMRKPAFSSRALISPVRLRRVASGLMIENVRCTAICETVPCCKEVGLISASARGRQSLMLRPWGAVAPGALGLLLPAAAVVLLPVGQRVTRGEVRLPAGARCFH